MEKEIEINGEKYIKKKEVEKERVEKQINMMEFLIPEQANVMGIVPFNKSEGDLSEKEVIEIKGLSKFKKFEEEIIFKGKSMKPEKFILKESAYNIEYLNRAIKTARAYLGISEPEFFIWVNEEEEYEKDKPVLIKFDNLMFLLAPRIDNNE